MTLALLVAAAVAVPGAAAAKPSDFARARALIRDAFGSDRLFKAVSLADELAGRPGLDADERAWALREAARLRALTGDRAAAEKDLEALLAARPGDADARLALARLLRDERPDDALRAAEQAAAAARDDGRRAAAWRLDGEVALEAGDDARARVSLEKALAIRPADLDALAAMARAERARLDQAAVYAQRADDAAQGAPLWYRGAADRLCASVWLDLGEHGRAVAAYERALALDADDLDALNGLLAVQAKKPDLPLSLDAPAPAPSPATATATAVDELEALRARAEAAHAAGRSQEAVADADLFLEAVPDAPSWRQAEAYRAIAGVLLELGHAPGARERAHGAAQRAFKLGLARVPIALLLMRAEPGLDSPDAPGSVEFAGQAFLEVIRAREWLHDRSGARGALERGLRALPGSRQLRLAQAGAELDDGRPAAALAALRLLQPGGSPALRAAALELQSRARQRQGDLAGAEASLQEALSLRPQDENLLDEMIDLEARRGDGTKAQPYVARLRADLAGSLAAEPGDWPTLRQAVSLELEHGSASSAAALLDAHRGPRGYGFEVPWLVWRGLASAALAQDAAAREDFREAVQRDVEAACFGPELPRRRERLDPRYFDACLERLPDDAKLHVDRGLALFEAGRAEAAVADFRRAVDLSPGDLDAQVSLVSALDAQGRPDEALAAADRALAAVGARRGPELEELQALRRRLSRTH